MEKFGRFLKRVLFSVCFAATPTACQLGGEPNLSHDQARELTGYVTAFHFCVAHSAARLDDGKSAIVGIAALALDRCKPEARGVSTFLDSLKLPEDAKESYIEELLRTASNQSAAMLRRRRDPDWGGTRI